ncbi:MAG: DUF192 domain-containing protein [Patescibacteria group bacterium]
MGDQTLKTISYATAVIGLAIIVLYLFFGRSRPLAVKNIKIGVANVIVEIVESFRAQERGLSGRPSLAPDSGMLFVYKDKAIRHFWMPDMNFALDALWIADGTVVGWQEGIQPLTNGSITRFQSNAPVDMVLEVNSGWISHNGIKIGDLLTFLE